MSVVFWFGVFVFFVVLSAVLGVLFTEGIRALAPQKLSDGMTGFTVLASGSLCFFGALGAFRRYGDWAASEKADAKSQKTFGRVLTFVVGTGWLMLVALLIGGPIFLFLGKHRVNH